MIKKWILEHNGSIEIQNSLSSIEREGLTFDKEMKDGVKKTKITARLISESVKNFGYYQDENYKIYQSQIINNK